MPRLGAGPRGYKDWQRVENWDDPLIIAQARATLEGEHNFGIFDVSRFGYLGGFVVLAPVGGIFTPIELRLQWANTAAFSQITGERLVYLGGNTPNVAQIRIPNMGPFVRVRTFTSAPEQKYEAEVFVFPTNRVMPVEFIPPNPQLIPFTSTVLKPGAHEIYIPHAVYAGPIVVSMTNPEGGSLLELNAATSTGGLQISQFFTVSGSPANQTFTMLAPPTGWSLKVTSLAGVEATFSIAALHSATGGA